MRLLRRYRFDCLRIHNREILSWNHLWVGLLRNLVRLLLWVVLSLVAVAIRNQIRVENPLLTLVVDIVIWNLLILNFVNHWSSLISISRLKDILSRNLWLLLLLPLHSIHIVDSRRLMIFIHFLESKDRLLLVVMCINRVVSHCILLSSLLLVLLLRLLLMHWLLLLWLLQLCRVVVATRFALMHTWLFRNRGLSLTLCWLGIVHLCEDSSSEGFIRNVIMLTLEEAFKFVAKKSKRIGYLKAIRQVELLTFSLWIRPSPFCECPPSSQELLDIPI